MSKYFKTIFKRDKYRCVYCGLWMLSDIDTFLLVEEDHLLPMKEDGEDNESNRVTSCRVCNMLKGDYSPGKKLYEEDRPAYIQKIREHIAFHRMKRAADFFSWIHPNKDSYDT